MRHPFVQFALVVVLSLGGVVSRASDDGRSATTDEKPEVGETIELAELSEPPERIAKLIEQGKVSMFYGRKPWREIVAARDRIGVSGRRLRLLAETKFELDYNYRSRSSWRIREGQKRELRVSVRYTEANLKYEHKIWFRHRPRTDGFWDDSLVLHEFDHVKISTKTILGEKFVQKLRASPVFTVTIGDDDRVDNAFVRKLIDKRVKDVFDEMVDLISIRYKELDRITDHGQRPIPAESKIESWLSDQEK